jgi:tRNA pseudouridine38-40 synthase
MPSEDLVEKVNSFLPPQIRLWGIQRTNNSFNSHLHCDSRVYEYILPSHCFLPPKPGSTAATCAIVLESQNRPAEPEDTFWDSIIDSDYFSLLRRYTANKKESPIEQLSELSEEELTRFESMKAEEIAAIRAFRISPSRLERIRAAIKIYQGTHNFHNLTIGMPYNSSQAKRYIISIDLGEPHLIASTEWLRIKIHGQSFMLHQIRKMIGAVLIAIRYGVGEESIRTTLTTRENMHIPKAPAQGLLLERPIFSGMSQKLERSGNEALHWEPYEEKIEQFKDDLIYKSIFRETTSENVYGLRLGSVWLANLFPRFHEFINFMDSFRYHEGKGLSMFVQGRQEEPVELFQKEEDDTENVEGDSAQVTP